MAGLIELWVRTLLRDELNKQRKTLMADLNAALDQLTTDVRNQIQQVADAIAAAAGGIEENAQLKAQLLDLSGEVQAAAERVGGLSSELQADDAPVDPPVDPEDPPVEG